MRPVNSRRRVSGKAKLRWSVATVAVSILAYAFAAPPSVDQNPFGAPANHFLCYGAKDQTVPKFAPISGVSLIDEFGADEVKVTKVATMCAPENTGAQAVTDAATE